MFTKKSVPLCDLKLNQLDEMSPLQRRISECVDDSKICRRSPRKRDDLTRNCCVRLVKVLDVKAGKSSSDDDDSIEDRENREKVTSRRSTRRNVKVIDRTYKEESSDGDDDDSMNEQFKRSPRRSVVKVVNIKPEESSSEESDDMEFTKANGGTKSAYEKMIEKNRAERLAFIKSLKMDEVKAGLREVIHKVKVTKKKVQPVKRVYKTIEKTSPPVLRKSRRLANINVDLSEDALFSKAVREAQESEKKKVIPPELPFKEALQFEELYESFVNDVNIQESKTETKYTYDKDVIKNLNLEISNIAKVTPDRITALTWHPLPDTLVLAAGSKYGNLGIWNIDSESSPYVFKTHLEGTTNLEFNPWNPNQLVSSSYDGTLRSGDMVKHVFSELYNVADDTCCTYFDFLSQTTYLVAQRNGQVAVVDNRTERKRCEKKHTCHEYSVKTVNMHPMNKNYFLTAENKGSIRLWDLRKLQKQPVVDIIHHKRCVQSAYFSPVTGNSVLTTSADDTICIFNSTNLTSIPLAHQMKHNNFTGRWLTVFRAKWLPNSEEAFVIGSMQEPRRIQVYNKDMDILHIIMHENLTTVSSTNSFHPFRPALAGGNSSGKVFAFI